MRIDVIISMIEANHISVKMKRIIFIILALINFNIYAQPVIDWETNLGGSDFDQAYSIQQTADGGYIVAGFSKSNDGDVGGNNGNNDIWIVRLDSFGSLIWETNLGGSQNDSAFSIQQTADGGYIVTGQTSSSDGDVSENNGIIDIWIVKLDAIGNLVWETNLGGSNIDLSFSVIQTLDGGYVIAGTSESDNGDVTGNYGSWDFWIVKIDAAGNLESEVNLGGSNADWPYSILQTMDGGYIVAGFSESNDGDVGGNNGLSDAWIVKLDVSLGVIWETNLGGSGDDRVWQIRQTLDGGYIVSGDSSSIDGDVGSNNGGLDYWIVKLDTSGNIVWETNLGGSEQERAYSIEQTVDGDYIVAGTSRSSDGDVGGNFGGLDVWIVKLDPNGALIWESNLGGSLDDRAWKVIQTSDDSYILAGWSESNDGDLEGNNGFADFWIVKLNPTLSIEDNTISNRIVLYPNPAENIITIANISENIEKIEVLDVLGQVVYSKSSPTNNSFNIGQLPKAMYMIKVHTLKNVYTQRIIKR